MATLKIICTRCKEEVKDILDHYEQYHPDTYKQYLNQGVKNGQKENTTKQTSN